MRCVDSTITITGEEAEGTLHSIEPGVLSLYTNTRDLLTGHGQGHHEECKFAEDIHVVLVLGLGFVLRYVR